VACVLAGAIITAVVMAQRGEPAQLDESGTFLVTRVIDGDTVDLEDGRRVRYLGVDAPETVHPEKPVQCYGPESAAENKRLVEGTRVRLERDKEEHDVYDRILRYVYIDGTDVSALLIAEGYGRVLNVPPNTRHRDQYADLQKAAKAAKLGLWGAC
jgi:micrococcal nuclease